MVKWWNDITAKVYTAVPDCIGYLIKANSEGQPGPLTYGRSLAEGANLFARALKPHGDGIVMYRAFVYNHHLDESDLKNDRANAAVDYFKNWEVFCDILWRISLAHRFAPNMLGADPTATRLLPGDPRWERMSAAAASHDSDVDEGERFLGPDELTEPFTFRYVRGAFQETLAKEYPRYQVEVPDYWLDFNPWEFPRHDVTVDVSSYLNSALIQTGYS